MLFTFVCFSILVVVVSCAPNADAADPFPAGFSIPDKHQILVVGWTPRQRRMLITKIWEHSPIASFFKNMPELAPRSIPREEMVKGMFAGPPGDRIRFDYLAGRCMKFYARDDVWDFSQHDHYCVEDGGMSAIDVYELYAKSYHSNNKGTHRHTSRTEYAEM